MNWNYTINCSAILRDVLTTSEFFYVSIPLGGGGTTKLTRVTVTAIFCKQKYMVELLSSRIHGLRGNLVIFMTTKCWILFPSPITGTLQICHVLLFIKIATKVTAQGYIRSPPPLRDSQCFLFTLHSEAEGWLGHYASIMCLQPTSWIITCQSSMQLYIISRI